MCLKLSKSLYLGLVGKMNCCVAKALLCCVIVVCALRHGLDAQSTVGMWRFASYASHGTETTTYYRTMFQYSQIQEEMRLLNDRIKAGNCPVDSDDSRHVSGNLRLVVANDTRGNEDIESTDNQGKCVCFLVQFSE